MRFARSPFRVSRRLGRLVCTSFAARRVAVRVLLSCFGAASSTALSFQRQRPGRLMTR